MRTTRGVARALAFGWAMVGGFAGSLEAETSAAGARTHTTTARSAIVDPPTPIGAPESAAAMSASPVPAATAACPATISCGPGCTATLASGFCVLQVSWEGAITVGGIQIGSSIKTECSICDCMYLAPGDNGTVLRRTNSFGCSITFPGVTLQ